MTSIEEAMEEYANLYAKCSLNTLSRARFHDTIPGVKLVFAAVLQGFCKSAWPKKPFN